MQLVRDAGFWGLALGLLGAESVRWEPHYDGRGAENSLTTEPSSGTLSRAGGLGLVAGFCLGTLAATQVDVSLERVRVATWGGYAGALMGALADTRLSTEESTIARSVAGGAALGLAVTFACTSSLDRRAGGEPSAGGGPAGCRPR